jgi:hypothetical protein
MNVTRSVCNILLIALVILSGCSSDKPTGPPREIIYSPNGEPLNGGLLGTPSCMQAMQQWFTRIDTTHQGISQSQFLADAQLQFARMDIDKNGYLVSEELDRFRAPYRQQPEFTHEHEHKKDSKKDASSNITAAPQNIFDPVMAADANLDFKVTPEEFMAHAKTTFDRLDTNHDGLLSGAEVTASCDAH